MVWLKRILWVGLAFLVLVAAAAGVYINRAFPALDGELKTAGLKAPGQHWP